MRPALWRQKTRLMFPKKKKISSDIGKTAYLMTVLFVAALIVTTRTDVLPTNALPRHSTVVHQRAKLYHTLTFNVIVIKTGMSDSFITGGGRVKETIGKGLHSMTTVKA